LIKKHPPYDLHGIRGSIGCSRQILAKTPAVHQDHLSGGIGRPFVEPRLKEFVGIQNGCKLGADLEW
jgi:hypothetical protein